METTLLDGLIDDRNQAIWLDVGKVFNLTVTAQGEGRTLHQTWGPDATIVLPIDSTPETFTHELLHLYLKSKRIYLIEYLRRKFREEPLLQWTFSESLMEQVGHYLEHVPMLRIYLRAGFDRTLFLPDYHEPICNQLLVELISSGLAKEIPSAVSAELFVRTYFRIRCHPELTVRHVQHLGELQRMQPLLFEPLDRFWAEWKRYDISRYDQDHYSYKPSIDQLLREMGAWSIQAIHGHRRAIS